MINHQSLIHLLEYHKFIFCPYKPVGHAPVEQLDPEKPDLFPTLNVLIVFCIFLLLHFLHLSSVFSEVTPINKSNFSPQTLHS